VSVGARTIRARVHASQGHDSGYTLHLWARRNDEHMHESARVARTPIVFRLRARPEHAVLFLTRDDTHELIDRWGDWLRPLPEPAGPGAVNKWRAMILEGESQTLEFKHFCEQKPRSGPTRAAEIDPDNIAREMVAFANTNDGTILLGVEDDATVCGLDDLRRARATITEIAHNNCRPPLTPRLLNVTIDEKRILAIEVQRTDRIHATNRDVVYVRRNGTVRRAQSSDYEARHKLMDYAPRGLGRHRGFGR
jgi:hypothetical protein